MSFWLTLNIKQKLHAQNIGSEFANLSHKYGFKSCFPLEGVSATIFAVEKFSYKFSVISVSYNVSTATHDLT